MCFAAEITGCVFACVAKKKAEKGVRTKQRQKGRKGKGQKNVMTD